MTKNYLVTMSEKGNLKRNMSILNQFVTFIQSKSLVSFEVICKKLKSLLKNKSYMALIYNLLSRRFNCFKKSKSLSIVYV